jgi:peptide/nickel transport system permease protein
VHGVLKYIARRLLMMFPTLAGMSMLIFLLIRLVPADYVTLVYGADETVPQVMRDALRRRLGLDQPIHVQYLTWLGDVAHGDFGYSFRGRRPVAEDLLRRVPVTVELAALSILIAVVVAVPLGVVSALKQNTQTDFWVRIVSLIGVSMPSFWMAVLLLLLTSVYLKIRIPIMWADPLQDPLGNLQIMALPALAVSTNLMGSVARYTRSGMLEVMRQDYVRTARAKGLKDRGVLFRHALKNALIPVVTVVGLQLGALLGGTVIIEQIFGLPGIGWLMIQAISQRDYPVVQSTVLFIAAVSIVVSLIVDLIYVYLDPRIRYA